MQLIANIVCKDY